MYPPPAPSSRAFSSTSARTSSGEPSGIVCWVLIPPQKLPDGDEMALILDPEGLSVGLMKPAGG